MLVKEIIEKLKGLPQNKKIFIYDDGQPLDVIEVFIDEDGDVGISDQLMMLNQRDIFSSSKGVENMKVYVLKFNDNEYFESFDLVNREVAVTDDKYNAEHIHSQFSASKYEEIEIEDY